MTQKPTSKIQYKIERCDLDCQVYMRVPRDRAMGAEDNGYAGRSIQPEHSPNAPSLSSPTAPRVQKLQSPRALERTLPDLSLQQGVSDGSVSSLIKPASKAEPDTPDSRVPPHVPPPAPVDTWTMEPKQPERRRYGSFSHAGPLEISVDKGNQDASFHLEMDVPSGSPWVLCGVADGVGQATWSFRAALHASAAFIEAFHAFAAEDTFPATEKKLLSDAWPARFAHIFNDKLMTRFEDDIVLLKQGEYIDPTYHPNVFNKLFTHAPDKDNAIRSKWFQTTLLAAALGPSGGFALFLGDGFVRIDRAFADGHWESSAGLEPMQAISLRLSVEQVQAGMMRLPARDATQMGILMTTDGVSNSTPRGLEQATKHIKSIPGFGDRPALERILPASSLECEGCLEKLSQLPPELADRDNMSIAFALRYIDPTEQC